MICVVVARAEEQHPVERRAIAEDVDLLLAAGFAGDIFAEAKRIVTHHYQWAVVHDFLERVCGTAAVKAAIPPFISTAPRP